MDQGAHVVAVIDLLLTIGYIDGGLNEGEQSFIRRYLDRLVQHVAHSPDAVAAWRTHVEHAYRNLDTEIAALASEVVAAGDDHFMRTRLKVRAVSLFRSFAPADQQVALELLSTVMQTDGSVSAQEVELRDELVQHVHTAPVHDALAARARIPPANLMRIDAARTLPLERYSHPLLDVIEQRYAPDRQLRQSQLASDYNLIFQAITVWERQRARGNGRLTGITDLAQLPPGTRLLDGHVHVMRPDSLTEVIVLGDLHGCYACLKAALLQSNFIDRALAHQHDPTNNRDVKLVLLGDYIDRGRFGFEGVLRAALQLLVTLPDHVILIRGNHEFLVRQGPQIVSAVNPAEAMPELAELAPLEIHEAYKHLFEHMPTSWLFDRTLFVHGGIPRDDTLAERFHDLSSLSDPVVRFEMMWSDPVDTDLVPVALQRESPRFNFGRDQFRAFMERVNCHTMIRGHEQVDTGFSTPFDLGFQRLHTLFSAGGSDNSDLPVESRYRRVTPMALTIYAEAASGGVTAIPWVIQYKPFTAAAHNGLYR